MHDINKDDLTWWKGYTCETDKKMTYIETLEAMCNYYGTFCGRWHSNEFWAKTVKELKNMSENQAKEKVFEIENDADGELYLYKRHQ